MSRKLRLNYGFIAKIGTVLASILLITTLINMVVSLVNKSYGDNFSMFLIENAINVIFYFIILSYFAKGKSASFYIYIALCMFLISDYILPTIMNFILQLSQFIINWSDFSFYFLSISAVLGIVYFILLVLSMKSGGNKYLIPLIVIGAILVLVSLAKAIFLIDIAIQSLKIFFSETFNGNFESIFTLFSMIVVLVSELANCALSILYLLFPICAKKTL